MKCRLGFSRIDCHRIQGCNTCPDYLEDSICPKCGKLMTENDLLFMTKYSEPGGDGVFVWRKPDGSIYIQGNYDSMMSCGAITIPTNLIMIDKCGHEEKVNK